IIATAVVIALTGCAGTSSPRATDASPVSTSSPSPSSPPSSPSPAPSGSPAPEKVAALFHATVSPIGPATRREMIPSSWRAGCPVRIEDLRLLLLSYWGFDGAVHTGKLVVNE